MERVTVDELLRHVPETRHPIPSGVPSLARLVGPGSSGRKAARLACKKERSLGTPSRVEKRERRGRVLLKECMPAFTLSW